MTGEALLFSGTSDGSRLSRCLASRGWRLTVCTATEYGESCACHGENITVLAGRLDKTGMEALLASHPVSCVIDATHPYAAEVSKNIRAAADRAGVSCLRLLRSDFDYAGAIEVASVAEAASYLASVPGRALLTTGSKELEAYTAVPDYKNRLFARVLSTEESVSKSRTLGFEGKNLIAMQGPFSEELNEAMLRQIGASFLVTKASGSAGGFEEKLAAAKKTGARVIVVRRPSEEPGLSLREIAVKLTGRPEDREVALVGIGMGGRGGMTGEAEQALSEAEVIFGAARMLEAIARFGGEQVREYRASEIAAAMEKSEKRRFAVALSGDAGFYSGAAALRARLAELPDVRVRTVCGVSSVAWLCGRRGISWEDAAILSLHGREGNFADAVRRNKKVFAIAGGNVSAQLGRLCEAGLGGVTVTVGSELSYEAERIETGTAESLCGREFPALSCLLVENSEAGRLPVTHGLPDESFLRGEIPMTKEEVRAVALARLRLTEDAVCYDVGAGTGSVTAEVALQAWRGRVYAIERKDEGCRLIEENCRRLNIGNVEVVAGSAPAALESLPAPTHAFLGGSGGTMGETVRAILAKNPKVRIVITAIALDTTAQVLRLERELGISNLEATQITAARTRTVGGYHMLQGGNPVTVFSFGGNEEV
ncbi:MAG: precorrin-6A reductase [Oscillospiraceae bacterium]|nr:precorrin-6A reductase [Oscillospiraceae bacterium]